MPYDLQPGVYPFTRGIHAEMYKKRLWTMRQYAGFGDAAATNVRFRKLLETGVTGLSMAFDLPTQIGMDSDADLALGEVGRVGVAIDTVEDMGRVFEGIDTGVVTTSMTINAPASVLLAMYLVVSEERGVGWDKVGGTVQNDILKEYAARGTYIYPPAPSIRLIVDMMDFCAKHVPKWNTISVSGYHIREAGATAAQEIAFTLGDGIEYLGAAVRRGLDGAQIASQMSFFFSSDNNFFEEIAKFRAARRMWAKIVKERFGIADERAQKLRFHCQTGGSTLAQQEPENNAIRVAYQAMAAVLGGCQSLHTNGRDEAISLPSEAAARLALRTQQVLGYETHVTDEPDPLGGAPFIEGLTDKLEADAGEIMARVEKLGGMTEAIAQGAVRRMIAESAYRAAQEFDRLERKVIGVNFPPKKSEGNGSAGDQGEIET
ncbi:methylmalonyl-CoA mutase, partial [Candidatus Sumerlaeota bacterium]|nr:methylmalonyl-CoA mutase [Candidatus Sumerlaeota bacterium]